MRIGKCVCGAEFHIPVKRGRPPVRCEACREAYANGTLADRLAQMGIDPDVALRKSIVSHPTSTIQEEINGALRGSEMTKIDTTNKVRERVDRLEMLLKSRNLHISQHRDKW